MFAFNLPKFAALEVSLPTGGGALMVHIGGGRFLSKVPPIALAGLTPAAGDTQSQEGLPLDWDGATLPGDGQARPIYFAFNVAQAQAGLEEAARMGDTFAQKVLAEMQEAEKVLLARQALGIMDPVPEAAAAAADPVEQAAADGMDSKA